VTIIHWRHLPFSRPKTALVLAVVAVEAIGAIGGIFTVQSVDTWYQTLTRPTLAPPGWVFAPVWTTLFALMGVALYRIWALAREQYAASQAVRWFLAHMALNVGWSAAFFGLESTAAGLAVIVVLWVAIGLLVRRFVRLDRLAGALLVPYWLWVTFAAVLNYQLWVLN